MKKILAASCAAVVMTLQGCASMQPVPANERTFDRVVDVQGHSKDQIYNNTKIWIAENFKSAKAVVEHDSKEEGVIIGNGSIPYPCAGLDCVSKGDWTVPFTMRVDMKDDKFKLTFSNINLAWPASYNSTLGYSSARNAPVNTMGDLNAIKPVLLKLGDELATSINSNKNKSNW